MQEAEKIFLDKKLDIPYFSQYLDVQNEENRPRACGMVCAYMALKHFGGEVPKLDDLIDQGIKNGGYSKSGWIHDYFVNLFKNFGYDCERRENMRDREVRLLAQYIQEGSPVMASVIRRMWDRRSFHIVLLTGVRLSADMEVEGFFYHDPAALRGENMRHLYVPLQTFYLDWRRMAILPKKS